MVLMYYSHSQNHRHCRGMSQNHRLRNNLGAAAWLCLQGSRTGTMGDASLGSTFATVQDY